MHVSERTLAGLADAPPGELTPGDAAVSAVLARMLACDAALTPIAWSPQGRVLDVGRTTRTVPTRLRLAVIARDRHCTYPGCRRPATACEAHHTVWWSRGGTTTLDGLALLCRYHHRLVHHHDLTITRDHDQAQWHFTHPDGTPWTGPPTRHRPRRTRAPAAA